MIKQIAVIMGGNFFAQLIIIASAPLLARIYLPEDFGILAVFNSVVVLVTVISSLRYEITIPLTKTKSEAANMIIVCIAILLGFCLMSTLAIALFGSELIHITGQTHLSGYIWLVPIGIFAVGGYQILNYIGIRESKYKDIAKSRLLQSIICVLTQLSMYKFSAFGLIIGQLIGFITATMLLIVGLLGKNYLSGLKLNEMQKLIKRYINFPKYSTWEGVLNSLSVELPIFIVAFCFSAHQAGIYIVVTKMLTMPAGLVINSISQVYYGHIANSNNSLEISNLTCKIHTILWQASLPLFLTGLLIGGNAFSWIFGINFSDGAVLVPYLICAVFFQLQSATLTPLIGLYLKQRQNMFWNLLLLLARVISLVLGVTFFDFETSVILYAISSAVMYFVLLLWILKIANLRVDRILVFDFKVLLSSCLSIFFIALAVFFNNIFSFVNLLILNLLGILTLFLYYKNLLIRIKFENNNTSFVSN